MNKHDSPISDNANSSQDMLMITCSIKTNEIDSRLAEINNLHPAVKVTIEREHDMKLDMKLLRQNEPLSSTWCFKPTNAGIIISFLALAPMKYKISVQCPHFLFLAPDEVQAQITAILS